VSGGTEYYGYGPDNKRVYRLTATGSEEFTFYGAQGEKLGVYGWGGSPLRTNIWFAGRLILDSNYAVYGDRVGTNRANGWNVYGAMSSFDRFYPYGDEITSTGNDRTKFATYNRDSFTGVDYGNQRYYASEYGRFLTADPYVASGGPKSPASWNRYSYTRGDPVNRYDPRGLDDCDPGDCVCNSDGQNCFDCDPSSPACWFCANPIDPDAPGPCLPPDSGGGGSGGGGGGGPAGNSFLGTDETDALNDLAKTNCYQLLGFSNAKAAQSAFNGIRFNYASYGQLSVIKGQPQAIPAPANTLGYGTININSDYNWGDFTAVTTQQGGTFNYLAFINRAYRSNLNSEQLGTLIILHELSHQQTFGNQHGDQESTAEKIALINDCIK
jgi:RHS repeat-associated protein